MSGTGLLGDFLFSERSRRPYGNQSAIEIAAIAETRFWAIAAIIWKPGYTGATTRKVNSHSFKNCRYLFDLALKDSLPSLHELRGKYQEQSTAAGKKINVLFSQQCCWKNFPRKDAVWTRAVNELLGKKYLFYPPSLERVRHFPSQEGATRIFPRKGVFAWLRKEGTKKRSPWSAAHGGRQNIISQEKQKWYIFCKVFIIFYLFYQTLRYFMFPRRKVSSEQIFQRTAVVDCRCLKEFSQEWFGICCAREEIFAQPKTNKERNTGRLAEQQQQQKRRHLNHRELQRQTTKKICQEQSRSWTFVTMN